MASPMDAKFRERGCLLGLGSLHKAGAGTFPPLGIQNLCSHLRMPPRVTTDPFLSHGCCPSKAQVPSRLSPQSSVALASLTTTYVECRLPFPFRSQRTRTYLNTSQCGGQTTVSITEEAFRDSSVTQSATIPHVFFTRKGQSAETEQLHRPAHLTADAKRTPLLLFKYKQTTIVLT